MMAATYTAPHAAALTLAHALPTGTVAEAGLLREAQRGACCPRNGWLPQRSTCTTSPTGRRVVGP